MVKVTQLGYQYANSKPVFNLLMLDEHTLCIDTRKKPWANADSQWCYPYLNEKFGKRYRQAGEVLGNRLYQHAGQIDIVDLPAGVSRLITYLQRGFDLVLLCRCSDYTSCHIHTILMDVDNGLKVRAEQAGLSVQYDYYTPAPINADYLAKINMPVVQRKPVDLVKLEQAALFEVPEPAVWRDI
ncbi:MAG: hypothetical protein PVS3B3_24800 [Ktedonobacteraceae bacterium]